MSKQFFRKAQVAERYGVDERTVDRMKLDGRLPPPHYRGRLPLWDGDELDAADRAALMSGPLRSRKRKSTIGDEAAA